MLCCAGAYECVYKHNANDEGYHRDISEAAARGNLPGNGNAAI